MGWYEFQTVIGLVGIYAILAISLNVICGLTGLLQLGHAGFYAVGAYAAGLVSIYATYPELGWANFIFGLSAAVVAASLFSFLIGLPCLRLRGDYLAIATLAFAEVLRLTLTNVTFPGGKMFPGEDIGGSTGISFTEFPGEIWCRHPDYSANFAKWWMIWIFVALTLVILINIKRSSFGRAMMCIRRDETAARSMGINVAGYKMAAFLLSAFFAGLAGALFFYNQLFAAPNDFSLMCSIQILLMVVLGGLGSLTGSLLAAVVLGLIPVFLMHYGAGQYQQLIYALLLIILIRIVPGGIFGSGEAPVWLSRLSGRRPKNQDGERK